MAGTVSPFPLPGTIPPEANPKDFVAPFNPPLSKVLIPLPILNAATVAKIGSKGFKELTSPRTALEVLINTSAKNLKLGEFTTSDMNAPNSLFS